MQRVEIDLPQAGQLGARPERANRKARRVSFAELAGRRAGVLRRRLVDLISLLFQPVLCERHRRRPEGVGQHGIRARREIAGVQLPHRLRAAEVEHLVAALKPVEVRERQVHRLNAGARRPIKDDRPLRGNIKQGWSAHTSNLTDRRAAAPDCPNLALLSGSVHASVIPAQAGSQAASALSTRLDISTADQGRFRAAGPLRWRGEEAHALGSCLRRNDGGGRRNDGRGDRDVGERRGNDGRGRRRCSGFVFSGCLGVILGCSLSGRGVRRCSGLFGFVQGCSGCVGRGDSEG